MNYMAHILCDDGYETDVFVTADSEKAAFDRGFWEALEQCLSPVSVEYIEETD